MYKFNSLFDALIFAASKKGKGIIFINGDNDEELISYQELHDRALAVLYNLKALGLKAGDELVFQLDDSKSFIFTFWACIAGSIIPVPLTATGNDEHRLKLMKVWKVLNNPYLIAERRVMDALEKFTSNNEFIEDFNLMKQKAIPLSIISEPGKTFEREQQKLDDIAFVQFSSGTTGEPKGVVLTHRNLLTNIDAILTGIDCKENDSSLSWMPLTHDMGIIGFHMSPLAAGINQYIMPTALFIRRPLLWMKKADQHRVTYTSSPNFGYKYFLEHLSDDSAKGWDLSCLRLIFNGAEPISADVCRVFLDAMVKYGLKEKVLFNVYGLAEASLAVSFPPLQEGLVTLKLDRNFLSRGQEIKPLQKHEEHGIELVDLGSEVKACTIRICDENNIELRDNEIGFVNIKGDNVTKGYYNNPKATADAITADGWLNTGDLGFIRNGRLVITGRAKDIIFVNGQNFYPHDIENTAAYLEGVEIGRIAACGVYDAKISRDRIVLFVLFKKGMEEFAPLALELKRYINRIMGLQIDDVVPVRDIPKTTSGKIQRYKLGENYINKMYEDNLTKLRECVAKIIVSESGDEPSTETEKVLMEMVEGIVGSRNIGINGNFFEHGIDSLKAARIISGVQTAFNVNIPLDEVFNLCSVRELANYIESSVNNRFEPITPNVSVANAVFEIYPLSSAQKRIYSLSISDKNSTIYNIPVAMKMQGKIDTEKVREAFRMLIEKHSALRTSFEILDGEPIQKVYKEADLDFCFNEEYSETNERAVTEIIREFVKPFDLNRPSLLRVNLMKLGEEEYLLMLDVHHIICDGGSFENIIKDFEKAYTGLDIQPCKVDFKDYVLWQEKHSLNAKAKHSEQYWLSQFEGEIPALDITPDHKRPAIQSYEGERIFFELDKDITSALKQLAMENKTTLNTVLLSGYYLLLHKYTGQEDIVVGTPAAGRIHPDTQDMVGMFVNTLALRNYPSGDKTFVEFLAEVKTNTVKAFENQDYPFEKLVDALKIKRDLSRTPLFDTVFVLQSVTRSRVQMGDISLVPVRIPNNTSKFDITVLAELIDDQLCFEMEYCSQLFGKSTMETFKDRFVNLLTQLTANRNARIADVEIITEAEKHTLLELNNSGKPSDNAKTVVEIFEELAARIPQKRALVFKNSSMTYGELNERANKLSRVLKEKGIKPGDIVGIMLTPCMDMVSGVLGILKAGAVFLPIDPDYPEERITYMLEDASVSILLTQIKDYRLEIRVEEQITDDRLEITVENKNTDVQLTTTNHKLSTILYLDDEGLYTGDGGNPECISTMNDLAYVIYTSGSTGKPKGVMVEHRALMNLCQWHIDYYKVTQEDRSTKYAGFGFDASVWEVFPYILAGSEIHIVEEGLRLDVEGLNRYFEENGISISFLPTQLCEQFMKLENHSLRALLTGGDKLRNFTERNYKLYNNYGPTENAVVTTSFLVDANCDNIPIGKPVSGCKLYIVDKYGRLTPPGIPGELCISGLSLARGYLNRPELTAEKFVPNLFLFEDNCPLSNVNYQLMYRTGDIARWLPDGNIEFLGRKDEQIKIRGFRIELGEIEANLLSHPVVQEAVVSVLSEEGENYLCAYCTAAGELDIEGLKDYLSDRLPYYMVPAYFIKLEHIPVNQNGKVDRKALPQPEIYVNKGVYVKPENDTERKLQEIWQEVLGVERISVRDSFLELGGHSLKATVLISRINKEFGVQVSAKQIFKLATIRKLAEYLQEASPVSYTAIPPVAEREYYPVTPMQRGLYIQNQLGGIGTSYNMPIVLCIEGKLSVTGVEKAFINLIETHDVLRTHFEMLGEQVVQKISESVNFTLEALKYDEINEDAVLKKFVRPFDLGCSPLFRAGIAAMTEDKHLLILDMHHIISDGISMAVLLKEFAELMKGEMPETPAISFKDYAVWQEDMISKGAMKNQKEYWKNVLSGEIPVLQLPYDFKRPDIRTFDGDVHKFELSEKEYTRIGSLAGSFGTTANAFLFAAYSLLLYKYGRQQDMIIGSLVAGRNHPELETMPGMFNNFLPIRVNPNSETTFGEFLDVLGGSLLNAYDNQDYPYNCILEDLSIKTDRSRNFLFDTMLIFHNQFEGSVLPVIPGLGVERYDLDMKSSKLDIKLDIYIVGDGKLDLRFEFNTRLFRKSSIERMAQHFVNIVNQALENPERKLGEFNLLSESEKRQILIEFNDTRWEYPKEKTLYHVLEEQAERTPDITAVAFGDKSLSYLQLLQKVNSLAAVLTEKGVSRGSIVGLVLERSLEMSIGIFAILKVGAAYMPMSPEYPADRIRYMMEDSGACLLLCKSQLTVDRGQLTVGNEQEIVGADSHIRPENNKIQILYLDDESIYSRDGEDIGYEGESTDLAYIIYTSGSTGKPKGAMIEHYSVINRINWMQRKYPIGQDDVILQKTPYTFDVSVWELFWWSFTGSKVFFLEPGGEKDPSVIVDAIYKNKVTTMHFVPSMLTVFLDYVELHECEDKLKSLRQVFASGEALQVQQVERFNRIIHRNTGATLHNLYGPTEATVDVSYYDCPVQGDIQVVPIGKPIDNIRLYVLDDGKRLLPIGVPGELYIAGDGVGRGYLNRPELTREKFMEDPFERQLTVDRGQLTVGKEQIKDYRLEIKVENQPPTTNYELPTTNSQRMYKTGDLARWLPDGNIEYLGRLDHQVKIRGLRIELGEIEAAVLKHEGVKETVVIDRKDASGNHYLCCYMVTEGNVEAAGIKEFLGKELPQYMVPSCFVRLESMPLSQNGKLDRKMLPEPVMEEALNKAYAAPETEVQERLVKIWAEVLGVERVGVDDNFFDMGGHSLKAASMVSRIQKEFCAEVRLSDVFNFQTVREMEKLINSADRSDLSCIIPVAEQEYYPLSSAQKRLFILYRIEGPSTTYNLPGLVRIDGKLDYRRLETTFNQLVKKHETLRTSFELLDGKPVQRIHNEIELKVGFEECIEAEIQSKAEEFVRPFDLAAAPLVRAKVIKVGEESHYLLFDMHHIISDGVSSVVLVKDFIKLYEGEGFESLKIRYREYVNWQNEVSMTEAFKAQEKYWLQKFEDEIPVLNLPYDYKRPSVQSFEGERISMTMDSRMAGMLRQFAQDSGTTLYMVLFSAYNVLLQKYSGQEDIVVGTPVVGRSHPEFEKLIGMFVNTVALRNNPVANKSFAGFLSEVKHNALEAFENQDYQFEELVQKLNIRREVSRNPLFDTVFVLQNMTMPPMEAGGLKFTSCDMKSSISKFDITFEAIEMADGTLRINLEYCTKLFKQETILSMLAHYKNICKVVVNAPETRISDIEILSEKEKSELLYEMNDTRAGYPDKKTIDELFEEQAIRVPQNTAIAHLDSVLSYHELNEKSNSLARYLKGLGVTKGSIVAVMLERSPEMIISALAILKAGGAYLPIELFYPRDRVEFMLEDSQACAFITTGDIVEKFEGSSGLPPVVDLQNSECYAGEAENLPRQHGPEDLAYIIYTSGTTGRPKGVMIEHRNVVRLMFNDKMQFDFNENDVWTMFHSFCFDFSVWEMYGALLYGGKLVIVPALTARDTALFRELLRTEKVTVLNQTPSAFYNLVAEEEKASDKNLKVRYVIFGGEALKPVMLKSWREKYLNCKLINMYGITETTVHVTYKEIGDYEIDTNISNIGKPIPTLTTYIMDRSMKLVPLGVAGELCVGGDGVGRGYLNRPELTAEKFVSNPYMSDERLYRSGDLARMLPDGDMEYLGRIDHQVKIRGFRIELGEIESELLKHEDIKEALIMAIDKRSGDKALCAYFVSGGAVTVGELKQHLMGRLPEYMVPAHFIKMDSFPLTSNGKVDRRKLPDPVTNIDTGTEFVAPDSSIEIELSEMWKELLGLEKVGINDNFFNVGGNSLLLVNMQSKLENKYPGKVKVTDLFMYTTISKLAEFIESADNIKGKISLKGMEMHENFFDFKSATSVGSTYRFKISGDTIRKAQSISKDNNISIYEFSLAAYMYLLSKTAGNKPPVVQISEKNETMMKQIELDISRLSGITELINLSALKVSESGVNEAYLIENIDTESFIARGREVAPLFIREGQIKPNRELLDIFGVVLELNISPEQTDYIFNFSGRIHKDRAKEFVNSYSKLVPYMVNQFLADSYMEEVAASKE